MPFLLALIPELIDALAAFIGATWWQLPVLIGLWKVQDAASSQLPPPEQQTPVQRVVGGTGQAAGGVGSAVGGVGSAFGSFGQFVASNPWLAVAAAVGFVVLKR